MKTICRLSILVLGLLLFASCSKDDLVDEEATNTDILILNSPWKFESFELIKIVEKEYDTITEKGVEKIVNETYQNLVFTFNEDGTGLTTLPHEEPFSWTWSFDGENKICFDAICDDESFTNVKLTQDSFQFENITASPEDANGNSARCLGKYLFK